MVDQKKIDVVNELNWNGIFNWIDLNCLEWLWLSLYDVL